MLLTTVPLLCVAAARPDAGLPRADVLAQGVLHHIDRRTRQIERALEQLARAPHGPRAADEAREVGRQVRRLRASLALVETYLLERRRELRRARGFCDDRDVPGASRGTGR